MALRPVCPDQTDRLPWRPQIIGHSYPLCRTIARPGLCMSFVPGCNWLQQVTRGVILL
jgi:hypothetical protein